MAFYRYQSNLNPTDRFDSITIRLDSGSNIRLDKGQTYNLSATEYQRASQIIVLVSSSAPAVDAQKQITLPVIGDLNDGDVPVWDENLASFVPGVGGGGGGVSQSYVDNALTTHIADTTAVHGLSSTAACKGVAIHNGTSYPSRPTGFASIEWVGPTDPGGSAQEGDTWVPTT